MILYWRTTNPKSPSTYQRLLFLIFSDNIIRCIKATKHLKEKLFKLDPFIEVEISMLNVFVYKNKNRFRNDKGFKDITIVRRSWEKNEKNSAPKNCWKFLRFAADHFRCQLSGQHLRSNSSNAPVLACQASRFISFAEQAASLVWECRGLGSQTATSWTLLERGPNAPVPHESFVVRIGLLML